MILINFSQNKTNQKLAYKLLNIWMKVLLQTSSLKAFCIFLMNTHLLLNFAYRFHQDKVKPWRSWNDVNSFFKFNKPFPNV